MEDRIYLDTEKETDFLIEVKQDDIVKLANLLFKLDNGEHTIPYEAWAEQILIDGYKKS